MIYIRLLASNEHFRIRIYILYDKERARAKYENPPRALMVPISIIITKLNGFFFFFLIGR